MAKSKTHLKRRGKINNIQTVYSEPQKIFKDVKYGKNRYTINPNAKPIKQIKHIIS